MTDDANVLPKCYSLNLDSGEICGQPYEANVHQRSSAAFTHNFIHPPMTDDAKPQAGEGDDLDGLERAAWAWEPNARLLGNVRAQTLRELCDELQRSRAEPAAPPRTDGDRERKGGASTPECGFYCQPAMLPENQGGGFGCNHDALHHDDIDGEACVCLECEAELAGHLLIEIDTLDRTIAELRAENAAKDALIADVRAVALMDPERMALPEERLNQIVTLLDALAAEGEMEGNDVRR